MNRPRPTNNDSRYNPYCLHDDENNNSRPTPSAAIMNERRVSTAPRPSFYGVPEEDDGRITDNEIVNNNDDDNNNNMNCKMSPKQIIKLPINPADRNDVITFLQSSPLTYKEDDDDCDNESSEQIHPIMNALSSSNDFDYEHSIIQDALTEGSNKVNGIIKVQGEIATIDKFKSVITSLTPSASSRCPPAMIHLSSYNEHSRYLSVEDTCGCRRIIKDDELKETIMTFDVDDHSNNSSKLQLVFISSYQPYAAADSFIKAGVPHVVCCQREGRRRDSSDNNENEHADDEDDDKASLAFMKTFYRTLASSETLKVAFDRAILIVKEQYPTTMMVTKSYNKDGDVIPKAKFTLLPSSGIDHNVQIFFKKPMHSHGSSDSYSYLSLSRVLPDPPDPFLGREIDMYRVIKALQRRQSQHKAARLVKIAGSDGKTSLVKAVLKHMNKRDLLNDVIWLPPVNEEAISDDLIMIMFILTELFDKIQQDHTRITRHNIRQDETYRSFLDLLQNDLCERKLLLVTDARRITHRDGIDKLSIFFNELCCRTKNVQIIAVVNPIGDDLLYVDNHIVQEDIELYPLDGEASVKLFGSLCRHVVDASSSSSRRNPSRELKHLYINSKLASERTIPYTSILRYSDVYRTLGSGSPTEIRNIAQNMTKDEYERLLARGQFKTRFELEHRIDKLTIVKNEKNIQELYQSAMKIEENIAELKLLRKNHPDVDTLRKKVADVSLDMHHAKMLNEMDGAADLQGQLASLDLQLELENKNDGAVSTMHQSSGNSGTNSDRHSVDQSSCDHSNQRDSYNKPPAITANSASHTSSRHIRTRSPLVVGGDGGGVAKRQDEGLDHPTCANSSTHVRTRSPLIGGGGANVAMRHDQGSIEYDRSGRHNNADQPSCAKSSTHIRTRSPLNGRGDVGSRHDQGSIECDHPGKHNVEQSSCAQSQSSYRTPPSRRYTTSQNLTSPMRTGASLEGDIMYRSHGNGDYVHPDRQTYSPQSQSSYRMSSYGKLGGSIHQSHPERLNQTSCTQSRRRPISSYSKLNRQEISPRMDTHVRTGESHEGANIHYDNDYDHHDQSSCAQSQKSSYSKRSRATVKTEPTTYTTTHTETRVSLDSDIERLHISFEKAKDVNDTLTAENIDREIKALENRKSSLPTIEELEYQIRETTVDMEAAKYGLRWEECEDLQRKIKDLQQKYELEREAEAEFRPGRRKGCDGFEMVDAITEEPSDISDDDEPEPWEVAGMPINDPEDALHTNSNKKDFNIGLYVPHKTAAARTEAAEDGTYNRWEPPTDTEKASRSVTPVSDPRDVQVKGRAAWGAYPKGINID